MWGTKPQSARMPKRGQHCQGQHGKVGEIPGGMRFGKRRAADGKPRRRRCGDATVKERQSEGDSGDLVEFLDGNPFQIPILLEGHIFKEALVDSGCECFSAISESVARELGCQMIQIPTRQLRQAAMVQERTEINSVACFKYDIEGFQHQAVAYVIPGLTQDIILGRPWMKHVGAVMNWLRVILQ